MFTWRKRRTPEVTSITEQLIEKQAENIKLYEQLTNEMDKLINQYRTLLSESNQHNRQLNTELAAFVGLSIEAVELLGSLQRHYHQYLGYAHNQDIDTLIARVQEALTVSLNQRKEKKGA